MSTLVPSVYINRHNFVVDINYKMAMLSKNCKKIDGKDCILSYGVIFIQLHARIQIGDMRSGSPSIFQGVGIEMVKVCLTHPRLMLDPSRFVSHTLTVSPPIGPPVHERVVNMLIALEQHGIL